MSGKNRYDWIPCGVIEPAMNYVEITSNNEEELEIACGEEIEAYDKKGIALIPWNWHEDNNICGMKYRMVTRKYFEKCSILKNIPITQSGGTECDVTQQCVYEVKEQKADVIDMNTFPDRNGKIVLKRKMITDHILEVRCL